MATSSKKPSHLIDSDTELIHDFPQASNAISSTISFSSSQEFGFPHKATSRTRNKFYQSTVRSINNIEYNEDDISLHQGSVVYFSVLVFVKELFYQTFLFVAFPIVYFCDGGMESAHAHGMVPWIWDALMLPGGSMWITILVCDILWIMYDFTSYWRFEIVLTNLVFFYRVFSISMRYAYLTSNEKFLYFGWYNKNTNFDFDSDFIGTPSPSLNNRNLGTIIDNNVIVDKNSKNQNNDKDAANSNNNGDNISSDNNNNIRNRRHSRAATRRQSMLETKIVKKCHVKHRKDVRHTMLAGAWFDYNETSIDVECINTELRLNWDLQSKRDKIINIKNCKLNCHCQIDIDRFIKYLIANTSVLQKNTLIIKIPLLILALCIVLGNCVRVWMSPSDQIAQWMLSVVYIFDVFVDQISLGCCILILFRIFYDIIEMEYFYVVGFFLFFHHFI